MKISIIGATGSVGTPTIFSIASAGLADEIMLLGGKRQNVLEHYARDLRTAMATKEVSINWGGYEDLKGSDLIVNIAGAHFPMSMERKEILKGQAGMVKEVAQNIKRYCPDAVVITGINPVDPLNYATYLIAGLDRKKLVGYNINDTFRFRQLVADDLNVKTNQVDAYVIGEHGKTQVPLFSSVKVDGKPVSFTEEAKERILSKIPLAIKTFEGLNANRTAGFTCAVGLTRISKAILEDSGEIIPCSIVLDGEYGQRDLSVGIPVALGKNGVKEIINLDLAPDEEEKFKVSLDTMKEVAAFIAEQVK